MAPQKPVISGYESDSSNSSVSSSGSSMSSISAIINEDQAKEAAAVKMQRTFRHYRTLKKLKISYDASKQAIIHADDLSETNKVFPVSSTVPAAVPAEASTSALQVNTCCSAKIEKTTNASIVTPETDDNSGLSLLFQNPFFIPTCIGLLAAVAVVATVMALGATAAVGGTIGLTAFAGSAALFAGTLTFFATPKNNNEPEIDQDESILMSPLN